MAVKMKTVVTYRASATATSHARTDVAMRDLVSVIDEPLERGGTNAGLTPTETALAALIACTNVIGHKTAKRLGIDLGDVTIDAQGKFDRRGVLMEEEIDVPFPEIKLIVSCAGGAPQAELDRVAQETAKYCAISKLFESAGTQVDVVWQQTSAQN